jgi:uncharacterized protein YcfJ
MSRTLTLAITMAALAAAGCPGSVSARSYDDRWQAEHDRHWDPAKHYRAHPRRQLVSSDRVYRGSDGRYYCKRSDGTTGLVLGALGGGLIGHALGGDTLGTILGAGGGALLGKTLDQRHDAAQNRRNGYVCD